MRWLLPLPLLIASQGTIAQDWTPIQTGAPNIEFSIDFSSVEREDDLVIFKERIIYNSADKIDPASGMSIKEKLVRRVMNCERKTQGMLSGSMRNESGVLIERVTFDRSQLVMAPIPPDTLAAHELELVCKKPPVPTAK